ncbi:MAG: hypothetical protein IPL49_17845 [Saprospirales bacterium]|nr:hypothetical protein [Saprospirales bacterium]
MRPKTLIWYAQGIDKSIVGHNRIGVPWSPTGMEWLGNTTRPASWPMLPVQKLSPQTDQ